MELYIEDTEAAADILARIIVGSPPLKEWR